MKMRGLIKLCSFFSHSIIINNLWKDKTLTTQEAVNPWNGTASPGLRATAKPRTHSWKIEPSKKGLWIPSLTIEEMELARVKGISMRQGGISGALHTSPSRLDHRPPLEHTRRDCVSQHTDCIGWRQLQGLETGPTGKRPVWSYKGMQRLWFWQLRSDKCCETEKSIHVLRPYAEAMWLQCHWQPLFKTCFTQIMSKVLALINMHGRAHNTEA